MQRRDEDKAAIGGRTGRSCTAALFYFHDPMCSWCWAFRPVLAELERGLPAGWRLVRILGGLAPDTSEPMPAAQQRIIRGIWRTIQRVAPGTEFNHAFWEVCQPRRSTYPACRAIIAAGRQGDYENLMIDAIQRAYYLEARNPSDDHTLIALAEKLGLDTARFTDELNAPGVQAALEHEIHFTRNRGVTSFPSLAGYAGGRWQSVPVDYHDPSLILHCLQQMPGL